MNLKLKIYLTFFFCVLFAFFFYPRVGLAVDFTIPEVKIDAYLHENGQVKVEESHTYSFDGDFNGITREIAPKEDASISNLEATEKGKALRVEREDDLYKIHRKGEDESITIKISYTIENGVAVYSDVAEFYWPFFDDRNESDYEKLDIVVHPPKETNDVIAFGYDEAFETEKIHADGSVLFQLGEVPSDENGDIRVAYDEALFPAANITADKAMKEEIIKAEQQLYDKAAERAEMRETLSVIAMFIVPIYSIIMLLLIVGTIMRARMKKLDVERKAHQAFFIPKEILSIPATIYFTKWQLPPEAMAAALMDLVRKGYVTKTKDNRFKQAGNSSEMLNHEQLLIDFLFNEIGSNGEFSFDDLKSYTEIKGNHTKYSSKMTKWQQAVINEVKEKNLYEKNGKLRWTLLIAGIILLPFVFLFPAYELFGWFFGALVLVVIYLVFAAAYKTKTWNGLRISHEWKLMKDRLPALSTKEWEALATDEQILAYIYGIGINDPKIIKKNEELIQSFKKSVNNHNNTYNWDSSAINLSTMVLIGPLATSSFHSAHNITGSNTSSSSSGSTGGGIGGGGGGSGAF